MKKIAYTAAIRLLTKTIILLTLINLVPVCYAKNYLIKPTGRYAVGFQDISLINTTLCPDSFYQQKTNEIDFAANNMKHCHEMILRVYYPVAEMPQQYDTYYAPYLMSLNNWVIKKNNLKKQDAAQLNRILNVRTYVKANLNTIANGEFPIILFSPGSGSSAQVYTNLISNVVSHGYIVIGINSMFINGPLQKSNGYIIEPLDAYQVAIGRQENLSDIKFTLDNLNAIPFRSNLKKHMNFNSIGLMGHSRGGISIVHLLNQYPIHQKIKAIILMDPGNDLGAKNYPLSLPNIPTLVMWSATFKKEMHGSTLAEKNVQNVVLLNGHENPNYSNHNNFCDFSTLQYHPAYANSSLHKDLTVGSGNGYEIAEMINDNVLTFFNAYLK